MSLSSLLLGSLSSRGGPVKSVDTELDDIFRSSVSTPRRPEAIVAGSSRIAARKRKLGEENATGADPSTLHGGKQDAKVKRVRIPSRHKTKVGKGENGKESIKRQDKGVEDSDDGEESSDREASQTLHDSSCGESFASLEGIKISRSRATNRVRAKYVPKEETPEQRDLRTIFVGNLSVQVAQRRPMLKQLHRHILASVPSAKIESTRFRSVPFQIPTKVATSDDREAITNETTGKGAAESSLNKQSRPHNRNRASSWRDLQKGDGEEQDGGKCDEKIFLNVNQKKKIAFINQEFHSSADTVNAYIVFAHPPPLDIRPSNLPPLTPIMDPYEAARLAVDRSDGTDFMERRIRVDRVTKQSKEASGGDPKLSIFVGNLDFASKEEDLRVFFEGIVSAERGPLIGQGEDEEGITDVKNPKSWVTRVRIVRDKDTQLGKGFAYVQFADRNCVDEVLALQDGQLKFAKRRLRVQRCKTIPNSSSKSHSHFSSVRLPAPTSNMTPAIAVPKGDPAFGEKIAHLPKDERKKYKSSDPDRVARRLAKKKARMALDMRGSTKPLTQIRDRVRKSSAVKAVGSRKEGKKRVRSEKSRAKQNTKK